MHGTKPLADELFANAPVKRAIFDFISKHPNCTRDQIIARVYASDADGGPESAEIITAHVAQMRPKLRTVGVDIESDGGRYATYKVVSLAGVAASAGRRRLANRRYSETIKFEVDGQRYLATVSYFRARSEPAEVFINTAMRLGSTADVNAADAALAVSLALQYGCPLETLRAAMKRDAEGRPQGPLGAAMDEIKRLGEEEDANK